MLAKPITVGIVAALGANAMGAAYSVGFPIIGEVPAALYWGMLGTGSSLVTETLHTWVLPYLPQSDYSVKMENALLSPAINAAVNVLALKVFYPDILEFTGYTQPIAIAVGSQIAGDYAFTNFIAGMSWMQ